MTTYRVPPLNPLYLCQPVVIVHFATNGTEHFEYPLTACDGTPFMREPQYIDPRIPRVLCPGCRIAVKRAAAGPTGLLSQQEAPQ